MSYLEMEIEALNTAQRLDVDRLEAIIRTRPFKSEFSIETYNLLLINR